MVRRLWDAQMTEGDVDNAAFAERVAQVAGRPSARNVWEDSQLDPRITWSGDRGGVSI